MSTQEQTPSDGIVLSSVAIGALALAMGITGASAGAARHNTTSIPVPAAVAWKPPVKTAPKIVKADPSAPRGRDLACLASAVWHEARDQTREGQIAVAEVVLARTASGHYPKRACAVIAQRSQFSFVSNGVVPSVPKEDLEDMMAIAKGVASGALHSRFKGAMWFHATYSSPEWASSQIRLGRIGAHIFYKSRI